MLGPVEDLPGDAHRAKVVERDVLRGRAILDWSFDPTTAGYFACAKVAKAIATTGNPNGHDSGASSVFALPREDAIDRFRHGSDFELTTVTVPNDTNPNLRAQMGTFTLAVRRANTPPTNHRLPTISMLAEEYIKGARPQVPMLLRFDLPHSECRKVLRLVADLTVSAATLFPGYDGAMQALDEVGCFDV